MRPSLTVTLVDAPPIGLIFVTCKSAFTATLTSSCLKDRGSVYSPLGAKGGCRVRLSVYNLEYNKFSRLASERERNGYKVVATPTLILPTREFVQPRIEN